MTTPAHIAIVGCGFAGTTAFFQLVDRYPVEKITIFERSGDFGPGYPYRTTECADYLINNTTATMCLVPSNRRAFIAWLNGRGDVATPVDESGHLPRALYGRFLQEVVAATRVAAAIKGIAVDLVPHDVIGMHEDPAGKVHIASDGGTVVADACLLTTGRCTAAGPSAPLPPAGARAVFIQDHVTNPALDAIPRDATVHVLGASLSAYDVVNRMFAPTTGCRFERSPDGELHVDPGPNERRVVLHARSGRLKAMQSQRPVRLERRHFTLDALRSTAAGRPLTLDDVASAIVAEARHQGANIDWQRIIAPYSGCMTQQDVDRNVIDWLSTAIANAKGAPPANFLVDLFASAQLDIWDGFAAGLLDPDEEVRYREHYETALLCYAAPCPVATGERLLALARAGRLTVRTGTRSIALRPDGAAYEITHARGTDVASVLVQATGALDRDVESPGQPAVIRDLVARNLLAAHRRGGHRLKGAAVDMTSLRSLPARNIHIISMLLWGPGFFTSSAFMMARLVQQTLAHLYHPAPTP